MQPAYDFGGSLLAVIFTNMGSGRKTIVEAATYSYASGITVVLDAFAPVSGQMYMVQVVGQFSVGAIKPIPFNPFEYDTTGEDYTVSATSVDAVNVQFVKTFTDAGAVFGSTVQYLTV